MGRSCSAQVRRRPREEMQRSARRWVVKVGSSLLMNREGGLHHERMADLLGQILLLHAQGIQIILVSSGAVGIGEKRLGWDQRPVDLASRQAAASVGQAALMHSYEQILQEISGAGSPALHCGQVLLTHEELCNRSRYLNVRSTLGTLLDHGVLPIVNENDAISYRPIQLGDNDTLAALVSNLWDADLMVLLTDQEGFYDADPRENPDARLLSEVMAGDPRMEAMAGSGGSAVGTGGMLAKVRAAARATRSGTSTVIASGHRKGVLLQLAAGEPAGTFLHARFQPLAARKRWLSDHLRVKGTLHIDSGAEIALLEQGASLLRVGVVGQEGNFRRGDLVSCQGPKGEEIARGLVNLDAEVLQRCRGKRSEELDGDPGCLEGTVIHRDNLVLTPKPLSEPGKGTPEEKPFLGRPQEDW